MLLDTKYRHRYACPDVPIGAKRLRKSAHTKIGAPGLTDEEHERGRRIKRPVATSFEAATGK
jgi:hypothetical protein